MTESSFDWEMCLAALMYKVYTLDMRDTVISVKLEKETKESAMEIAKAAGLTLSSLISSYLKQVVATRRIELYAPEPMTPKLEKLIAEVEKELKDGKASKGFKTAEAFVADLKK